VPVNRGSSGIPCQGCEGTLNIPVIAWQVFSLRRPNRRQQSARMARRKGETAGKIRIRKRDPPHQKRAKKKIGKRKGKNERRKKAEAGEEKKEKPRTATRRSSIFSGRGVVLNLKKNASRIKKGWKGPRRERKAGKER